MSSDAQIQTTSVDPSDVKWETLFESEAGGRNESLGMIERTEAVQRHIPEIASEHTADQLISDALDAGILVMNGDDIRLADAPSPAKDVSAEDIDWASVFNGAADSPYSKFPATSRFFQIVAYSPLESEEEAQAAWEQAVESGLVVRKSETEGSEGAGYYLADEHLPDAATEPEPERDEVQDEVEVHDAVEELRDGAESEAQYIQSMEQVLTDVLGRLEKVENRQNRIFAEHDQQRTGLIEMQIKRLRKGDILSRDGIDEKILTDDFGYDLVFVGEEGDMVRLADRHKESANEDVSNRAMPDFDNLCELEENRMKDVLGIVDREEIKSQGVKKYRGMVVWDDATILDVSDNGDVIDIPSSKVREKLRRLCDGVSGDSLDETVRRVMNYIPDHSGGVFSLEKESGTNHLRADVDDFMDERVTRFQKSSIDSSDEGGSANTVVSSREGVSVSSTGR